MNCFALLKTEDAMLEPCEQLFKHHSTYDYYTFIKHIISILCPLRNVTQMEMRRWSKTHTETRPKSSSQKKCK